MQKKLDATGASEALRQVEALQAEVAHLRKRIEVLEAVAAEDPLPTIPLAEAELPQAAPDSPQAEPLTPPRTRA